MTTVGPCLRSHEDCPLLTNARLSQIGETVAYFEPESPAAVVGDAGAGEPPVAKTCSWTSFASW